MPTSVSLRRVAAAAATAAGVVLVTAIPAAAHVSVSSLDAAPGGFGKLVFRVPNESDSADTTKLTVQLPTDTPFAAVSTMAVPGWNVQAEPTKLAQPVEMHGATITEAVTSVTWTAQNGQGLAPGEFGEFALSVGTFPENVDTMSFPATQTYSDGEVVQWNQKVAPGTPESQEPERPAPTLEIAAADVAPTAATAQPADSGSSNAPLILSGVAVALGGAALLVALRPRPRKS
jgi:periplasmic copper chaperone A